MFSFKGLCRVNFFGSEFWAQRVPTEEKESVIKRMKTLLLTAQMTLDSLALSNNATAKTKRAENKLYSLQTTIAGG